MPLTAELRRIERDSGGRLGVAILDTKTSETVGQHADDRFPMCSTFKLLATAAVLKRVEDGKERLDRRIVFKASDVVVNSPITKERAGGDGISLEELCEAAMTYSDNTAGNLILVEPWGAEGAHRFCALARRHDDASRPHRAGAERGHTRRSRATPPRRRRC